MRISDWSDVCSSVYGHLIVVMGIIGRRIGSKAAGWPMFEALIDRQDDHLASTTQTALHQHARKQIGRASCRESVCQYVYISVFAVTLKKKNQILYIVD